MIDPSIIEDILKHADIVDVVSTFINVIKKGRNFVAVCPFHDDKNPSMMLSRDKQIFKCFGCGEGGDVFTFLMKINNQTFSEVIEEQAAALGIELPKYNSKNADKPIRIVTCGTSPNWEALNSYIRANPESEILKAPNFDDFKYAGSGTWSGDWHSHQYILWQEHQKLNERSL